MFDFMPTMALAAIAILLGFIGLVWSADRFVGGAASIAEGFGIAPVIIGLTIVSFGTSAPEVMVSLIASAEGAGDLAVGNALGSNIANVGLVLGVTTLIGRIPVDWNLIKHESVILIGITLIAGVFLYNSHLNAIEGWILLLLLIPIIRYLVATKQRDHKPEELIADDVAHYSAKTAIFWFVTGLLLLVLSSKTLVWGAETTALNFGVSPLIIGLTIIAIGTSLPELAASVMSALRGHHDIAVGNIVGSNMFNLLAVMSIPGIFGVEKMEASVFSRDYVAMLVITVMLIVCILAALWRHKSKARIGKLTGVVLLAFYVAYMALLGHSQFVQYG